MIIIKILPFKECDICEKVSVRTEVSGSDVTVSCGHSDICKNAIELITGKKDEDKKEPSI